MDYPHTKNGILRYIGWACSPDTNLHVVGPGIPWAPNMGPLRDQAPRYGYGCGPLVVCYPPAEFHGSGSHRKKVDFSNGPLLRMRSGPPMGPTASMTPMGTGPIHGLPTCEKSSSSIHWFGL